jgi:hypothetical protein
MDYTAHATAIIDPGARIGQGTRIWHSILENRTKMTEAKALS